MESPNLEQLSRRERQIMLLVFEKEQMTVQQVMEQLENAPSYTTVRTLMRILEEKGHLKHFRLSRQYVYQPVTNLVELRQHSLEQLLKTFFGGSITRAVATFINNPDAKIKNTDLTELENLVQKAKEKYI